MNLFRRREPPRIPQVREPAEERQRGDDGKPPQPERREPHLERADLGDLSKRDYLAIVVRAGKEAIEDNIADAAASIAYYSFLAIPATLLLAVGLFSLFAEPGAIDTVMEKLGRVVPAEAVSLLRDSLRNVAENDRGGRALVGVGTLAGLWTVSAAMSVVIDALNTAYDRAESRAFVRRRLTALAMFAFALVSFPLVFGLLVFGPAVSGWIGDALGLASVFELIWWTGQWPVLVGGMLVTFAAILYLGPNVDHPRWVFLTPGSVLAVVLWLSTSGLFALYVGTFGSYNKAWGSIAGVMVMLTWLWLSTLALLFGAEVNAEAERSRELRAGMPAQERILAPPKS